MAKKDLQKIDRVIWDLSVAQTVFMRDMIAAGATNKQIVDVLKGHTKSGLLNTIKLLRYK